MKKKLSRKTSPMAAENDGKLEADLEGAPAKPGAANPGVKKVVSAKKVTTKKVSKTTVTTKPASKAAPKKAPPVRVARGGVPFICSECYEEFILPATYSRETVTCPECMHVGKRPAEDFLRTVTVHKNREQKDLKMALFATYMLLLSGLILFWLASPYSATVVTDAGHKSTGLMLLSGLAVLSVALLVWSVSRYEKNRWEVYF